MPLPDHPFTVNGGCNCRAIRYKITVPAHEDRPLNRYCDPSALSEKERFPAVLIDHCNDCRRATAALLPVWIAVPMTFIEFSCSVEASIDCAPKNEPQPDWISGNELLQDGPKSGKGTALRLYNSSPGKYRGFCGNCGTMLMYKSFKFPESWPDMMDILLGTVDREDLERDWMKPTRELWWDKGIPWIQELVREGTGKEDMPRHPLWKINEPVVIGAKSEVSSVPY